jgi:hypothetical protein
MTAVPEMETTTAAPVPGPGRADRDEVFLEYTKSICPVCKSVIDAEVNARDNKVYLRKSCAEHGRFEALVYSDAELYLSYERTPDPPRRPALDDAGHAQPDHR